MNKKDEILEQLRQLVEILEKNRIPYYIINETLEGAVSRKGLLDSSKYVDLAIPRGYYEKALRIYRQQTEGELGLVRVFVLDGVPKNLFIGFLHRWSLLFAKTRYYIAVEESPKIMRFNLGIHRRMILKLYSLLIKKGEKEEDALYRIDKILKRVSIKKSEYFMNFMNDTGFMGDIHSKEDYGKGAYYEFEDMMLRGPLNKEDFIDIVN